MPEPIRTVGIIYIQNNEVLLVTHGEAAGHNNNTVGIPAGRIEAEETMVEAAIREFNEETGLDTTAENLIELPREYERVLERKDGPKLFHVVLFLCTEATGELKGSKEAVPNWVNLDHVKELNLLPNVENFIRDALQYRNPEIKFR